MAGIARPSDDILIGSKKEMTDYEIIQSFHYNCGYDTAYKLFNRTIGKYYADAFDWNYNTDYITIKINKPCNLYIHLTTNALGDHSPLNIQPTTYEQQNTLQTIYEWQLWVTKLQPGTYTFSHLSGCRNDTEWFFEEITTESQMIKNNVKNTILNNKLFQEHCVPYENEEG